ncbi:tRNA 2-selenouridine(34) synthase MnmH [Candidatus Woesearchaeota archaeon]|nr:tRNA 2-selenouridine(34) synthase MnmH [Candidatus Woesearchaeota archaeon]
MKTISVEEALSGDYVFIDVRTPKEFEESTIPGAVNVPLFSNEERAVVGTLYAQKGQDEAFKKGLDFVSKSLPNLLEAVSKYKKDKLIVFCWRGGMRSKSLTGLLEGLGYDVRQLEGGHKAYRNYILERFKDYKLKPKLIVLNGLTGAGKTEILKQFSNSLDLEGLAQHRSSILGSVGLNPVSQKMFDALLFKRLEELKDESYIIVEYESKKIGHVQMPAFLYKALKEGVQVKIVCSFDDRVKRLVEEYSAYKEELAEKIMLMRKSVGNDKKINEWLKMLKEDEFEELAARILKEYYDPLYSHTVDAVKYDYVIEKSYIEKIKNLILSC